GGIKGSSMMPMHMSHHFVFSSSSSMFRSSLARPITITTTTTSPFATTIEIIILSVIYVSFTHMLSCVVSSIDKANVSLS
ncbi:hypothetical protein, partial [Bacillus sp. GbtcB13]|uniref:hypothetical protein n=1 Tax=Bacillus sp. GbtcB13 TaxID=2824758 RepID=UPI001C30196D